MEILTHFETFDLIRSQSSVFCDFIEVNISIGICAVSHFEAVGTLGDEAVEKGELPVQLTRIIT